MADEISYVDAMAEIDQILSSLDRDDVDIDALGAQVCRASALIANCRAKIDATKLEITEIVAGLDEPTMPSGNDQ